MATITVSLPDPVQAWIEAQVTRGDYASASDDIADRVRRDRDRQEPEITLEELRAKLAASQASGLSDRTVDEIFAAARADVEARGVLRP
jgi:antitoxin ParD1/3/4